MSVTHDFVSQVADCDDDTLIQASDWNKDHKLSNALKAVDGLTPATGKLPYFNGADSATLTDITATGISLVGAADAAAGRTAIGAAAAADLSTKADLVNGLVPSSQLPSYVDDVLEYDNLAAFPEEGVSGKIYIALDTNLTYRWAGSGYGVLNPSLALGETESTAYRGDRGKAAYDHSQTAHSYAPSSHVGTGGTAHAVATESVAGFMAAEAMAKLNGIEAGATADMAEAEILAAIGYKQGTFTPTVYGSTTAGTGTYTNQKGVYTKVGNRVDYYIFVTWSAHTGAGNALISGLPFTSNSACHSPATVCSSAVLGDSITLSPRVAVNTKNIALITLNSITGATTSFALPESMTSLHIQGTYFV